MKKVIFKRLLSPRCFWSSFLAFPVCGTPAHWEQEYQYEIFIYRPGLYLSVRQTMQEMEKSKWSSLAWRFDDFSFPCKFTTWNVVIQSLILRRSWCSSTLTMLSWQTRMVSFSSWVTETMFISSWRGTTVCVPSASSNSSLQIWVVRKTVDCWKSSNLWNQDEEELRLIMSSFKDLPS